MSPATETRGGLASATTAHTPISTITAIPTAGTPGSQGGAVLEVVASQVLQRAGDAAASAGRIEPHHIRVAVRRDEDLARLVGSEALEEGGLLRPVACESRSPCGVRVAQPFPRRSVVDGRFPHGVAHF